MVEDLNALELLQDEMKTDEVHLKVNAVHRMKTVILCIGVEDATKKMVEYLGNLVKIEDDEVLFAIAEELGICWDLLPDKTIFLPLLEKLCQSDETVVREQAAKSMATISVQLTDQEMQLTFAPAVIRLSQAEWFYGRVSACHLFAPAYKRANA